MSSLVVILSGLPGTGKSTIARFVADHLGAAVLSVDSIEAAMNRSGIHREHGQGSYRAGYAIISALAADELCAGRSVVADATYVRPADRDDLRHLATVHQVPAIVIATTCRDRQLHRERLDARRRAGLDGFLYAASWEQLEPHLDGYEVPADADVVLDAADPLSANAGRALHALDGVRGVGPPRSPGR